MNRFLNRILAPGLRRVGPAGRFESPRQAEPARVEPVEAEPAIEEIVEEPPASPIALPSFPDQEKREAPPREGRSREEAPSLSRFDGPEGGPLNGPTSPRPVAREAAPFFEERVSSASGLPAAPLSDRADRPDRSGVPPIAGERPKGDVETISFEEMAFDPAVHPSIRRFQPSGEKPKADEASDRAKSDAAQSKSDAGPAAREIVWEVVPAESSSHGGRPLFSRKGEGRQEMPPSQGQPSEGERSESRSSDPIPPASSRRSSDRPPHRAAKEEGPLGPAPSLQDAPIPMRGATLPRPGVGPKEEKGDLIIEQLEVRVVAEPERRPEPPKRRPAAPKRSGAWETAARYYLGKV